MTCKVFALITDNGENSFMIVTIYTFIYEKFSNILDISDKSYILISSLQLKWRI
uniref:Uncharacterized protein n=1 Tax=viral metagenome TaxID=1070528 RepID=A0A6C0BGU5_9ZZZZ